MSNCRTCKFMAAEREERFDNDSNVSEVTLHTCVRIIHANGHAGDYRRPEDVVSAKQPAVVIDGSGYQARLIVTPAFGCVLHEPKEA